MKRTLNEFKILYYHKKRLEKENDRFRTTLTKIKDSYSPGTRAHKIAKKALEEIQT